MTLLAAKNKYLNQWVMVNELHGLFGVGIDIDVETFIDPAEDRRDYTDEDYDEHNIVLDGDVTLATNKQIVEALQDDIIEHSFNCLQIDGLDMDVELRNYDKRATLLIEIGCQTFTPKELNHIYIEIAKRFPKGEKVFK